MDTEDFEFALSEYLDGALTPQKRAAVEERLRTDPAARATLDEFTKLNSALQQNAAPMPALHWDRFAESISDAIDESAPARNYSIRLVFEVAGMALAASVLIVLSLMMARMNSAAGPIQNSPVALAPVQTVRHVLTVQGPQADVAVGPQTVDVQVSPPAEADAAASYAGDSLVVRRSMVALDGFTATDQVH